ncbi:Beta-barrel assembly machine subunit BamA [Candidatus Kryptonium thompsonii]|uniref:outer membrane protein assembly factor BamA n=1 Tax=Candidatus Kryptonium thompsonii TaxID=1633631 RepID=UPI0007075BD0|nr:outer membrane protein assembly factor BamA [Candidatus Kryptonium thompsoni]CUS89902.1 Beta-barrel assembly machine subunit BamA [Candidatus Kryptonium thompsoni]
MRRFLSYIFLILFLVSNLFAQQQEVYKILGISVEGNTVVQPSAIIANSGLKVGDEISFTRVGNILISGDKIRNAIKQLWALRVFKKVSIEIENQVGDGVYLLIRVEEYPRLDDVIVEGAKAISVKDIKNKINLVRGQVIAENRLTSIANDIRKAYEEKGYFLVDVKFDIIPTKEGRANLKVSINEGKKISIKKIIFEGNVKVKDGDLKGEMKDTKEKKWWMFWRTAKFDRKKYEEDKKKIIEYYRKKGFKDATILDDSVYVDEKRENLFIKIKLFEGPQYKIRNITWEGNTIFDDKILSDRLGFKSGEVYNREKFERNLYGNEQQTDVASLYLDNGYLTMSMQPEEVRVAEDTLDIVIHVFEGKQFRIRRVDIKGNTKTKDKVIRRELYTVPGKYFSRSDIVRSIRNLAVLNYFNPEKLKPDYRMVSDSTVDLTYEVEEKSSDTFNASVGYSSFGLIGSIGVTFNNFSITEPWRGGDGQMLNFEWVFGRYDYRTFSLGFREPWFRDTPTSVGFNIVDTRYAFGYELRQTGGSFSLGKRLRWPDDYFRIDYIFGFQIYDVSGTSGYYSEGKWTQFSLTQIISRNSVDNPIFPSIGSNVSLSTEISGGPIFPGTTDYFKIYLNSEWFARIFNWEKLVWYNSFDWGYVDGFRRHSFIPPIELFSMGGTGLGYIAVTPLRGYEDMSIAVTSNRVPQGRVLMKYTTELRFGLTMNPMPIYLLIFAEAGNAWAKTRQVDLFSLKRSAGFGVRLYMQPIGLIGFDYGYGFDDVEPKDGKPDGWRFHFQFGRGF